MVTKYEKLSGFPTRSATGVGFHTVLASLPVWVSALFPDRFVLKQAEINPAGSPDGKSINSTAPLTHRAINRPAIAQRRLKPAFLAYFHPAGNAQEKPHLWGAVL